MTLDQTLILEKLDNIVKYVKEAKILFRFSEKEILESSEKMHVAERIFQLIVECMLDINRHIIVEKNLGDFTDAQATFYTLGDNEILPGEFAFKIAPVASVRNRLVHDYGTLNAELFITNFRNNYTDFIKYIEHINNYLKQ